MEKEWKISEVALSDLPEITELAKEAWRNFFENKSEELIDAACGMIVRNNYIEPSLSFKVVEDGKIIGVLFAGTSGSASNPEAFFNQKLDELGVEDREWLMIQRNYHKKADQECSSLLKEDTFKLALFMSAKKGCGKKLLNHAVGLLKDRGFSRMALWTDSSCSYEYYPLHGFTQQSDSYIQEYSTPDNDYHLYTFTKEI